MVRFNVQAVTTGLSNLKNNTMEFVGKCKTEPLASGGRVIKRVAEIGLLAATTATGVGVLRGTIGSVNTVMRECLPGVAYQLPWGFRASGDSCGGALLLTACVSIGAYAVARFELSQLQALGTKFFGTNGNASTNPSANPGAKAKSV